MVLQRTSRNVSEAAFSGNCKHNGWLEAVVRKGTRTDKTLSPGVLCQTRCGRFQATLRGLPSGGPYNILLRIVDDQGDTLEECQVRDVMVGDVWILGGQSNMQGYGDGRQRCTAHPDVRAFYMHDRWGKALDPIHDMSRAVDPVHKTLCGGVLPSRGAGGVGPGVAFGVAMQERTGVPQGLLACAHGGTSMAQWDPALKKEGGDSLYGATVRRLVKNGNRIAGVVWYQGESDANGPAADVYTQRMKTLIKAFRRDAHDPNLPFALVQISRVLGWPVDTDSPWNRIQDAQRLLPQRVKGTTTAPSIDLSLTDCIHIEGVDQHRLGRRLAQAMAVLKKIPGAGRPPLALGKVSVLPNTLKEGSIIRVQVENVMGRLQSGSRPVGFSFGGPDSIAKAFDVRLGRSHIDIYSNMPVATMLEQNLYYGRGTDPVCNITDEADRALPVAGPLPLGDPTARTPFCQRFHLTHLTTPFPKLGRKAPAARGGQVHNFPERMADVRTLFDAWPGKPGCVVYRTHFTCSEAMKLCLCLGYDGPVAAWLDGRRLAQDPKGTNPALPDEIITGFGAAKGKHLLQIALGDQGGGAWGIMVRLGRTDLTTRRIRDGHPSWAMPTWTD